jgi:hypothetical protein
MQHLKVAGIFPRRPNFLVNPAGKPLKELSTFLTRVLGGGGGGKQAIPQKIFF